MWCHSFDEIKPPETGVVNLKVEIVLSWPIYVGWKGYWETGFGQSNLASQLKPCTGFSLAFLVSLFNKPRRGRQRLEWT
jgi:hypothetical protein